MQNWKTYSLMQAATWIPNPWCFYEIRFPKAGLDNFGPGGRQWTRQVLIRVAGWNEAELSPRLSLISPKVFCFSPFQSLMEFWILAAVAFGLLSWGRFISGNVVDLIAQILLKKTWTELDDNITESMMNWKTQCLQSSSCPIDTLFSCWHCKAALTQSVLYKVLYK